jgi:neutral ceramidase
VSWGADTGRRRAALAAAVLALLAAAPATTTAAPLRAGAASSDITPPVGTPMFAYTARSLAAGPDNIPDAGMQVVADPPTGLYAKSFVPSRGIHTRIKARALVLQGDRGKLALVQADLGGVPYLLTREVARRVAGTGITVDRIVLSATHTHSSTGPIWPSDSVGYAALGGDFFDNRIFQLTADGIAAAILRADGRLAPARAGVGKVTLANASRNRGFDPFRRNPDVPKDERAARQVSIDPTLTVLRVDSADGRPLAAWSNFAIHPTSFGDENLLFSGDNAGYAERYAEEGIAARARKAGRPAAQEVVNVWTNGAEGDVSPSGDPDDPERQLAAGDDDDGKPSSTRLQYVNTDFASAHLAGKRVGEGIARAWADAGSRMATELDVDGRSTWVAFDGTQADGEPVGPQGVLGAGGIGAPDGFCAPFDNVAGPGQGRKFPGLVGGPALVPGVAPVSLWRVGRLGIASYPSEITKQMGLRIRGAVAAAARGTFDDVVLNGMANSYVSYTATPEEYDGCNYEGSFTLYGRRQGPLYRNAGAGLAQALAAGQPAPPGAREPDPAPLPTVTGTEPHESPQAGQVVRQPAESVRRYGQAVFAWRGGDPQLDAPRGSALVQLQARSASGEWRTVATDDSYRDTTERSAGDLWTERYQFTQCSPTGTYRFVATGRADRGGGPAPYTATSRTFTLGAISLTAQRPTVSGRTARFVALYPDPGKEALLALPRRVRSGSAVLEVRRRGRRTTQVLARPDRERLAFVATVPAGSTVRVLGVHDSCGNGFGPRAARRVAAKRRAKKRRPSVRKRRPARRQQRPKFTG